MKKEQIIEAGYDLLEQNPDQQIVYATADGNLFWDRNNAVNHNKNNVKEDLITIERKAVERKLTKKEQAELAKKEAEEAKAAKEAELKADQEAAAKAEKDAAEAGDTTNPEVLTHNKK